MMKLHLVTAIQLRELMKYVKGNSQKYHGKLPCKVRIFSQLF